MEYHTTFAYHDTIVMYHHSYGPVSRYTLDIYMADYDLHDITSLMYVPVKFGHLYYLAYENVH